MSLLDAPIWHDAGTWIVLGISLLFIVVGAVMHHTIMKVVRAPAPEAAPAPAAGRASGCSPEAAHSAASGQHAGGGVHRQ